MSGGLIIGDSGSLLNSQRLKGIHTAIKSGMLAAETIFEALRDGDTSAAKLSGYAKKLEASWIKKELWAVRNFHQGYEHGLLRGLFHTAVQMITGGRGFVDPMRARAGYEEYKRLDRGNELVDQSGRFKGDGALTFDRLTDVFHSGTRHEEDQPCHLIVLEPDVCGNRCVREYGNPCQYFCPAAVYEMVREKDGARLKINASNCVHCKTCDIADPYQIINWVPPEGGRTELRGNVSAQATCNPRPHNPGRSKHQTLCGKIPRFSQEFRNELSLRLNLFVLWEAPQQPILVRPYR